MRSENQPTTCGVRPRARSGGLVLQDLGDEALVFDRDRDIAHCLSPLAARVWRACDGEHDLPGLAAVTHTSENLVAAALSELSQEELLDTQPSLTSAPDGVSRRGALKRIGAAGLAATGVPLIVSATVGAPLAHASGGTGAQCATCTTTGTNDSCGPGLQCDPAAAICVPSNCTVATCTSGNSCSVGIFSGTCTTACATTLCCA